MSGWDLGDPLADDFVTDPPTPLASLVYLTRELRRRWRTCAAMLLIGLCLAGLYDWHFPPDSVATITLSLQHPSGSDTTAMQTDVAILETREVARRTLAALGDPDASVDDFVQHYSGTPTTSSILMIRVKADSPDRAVRTAQVLASTYLAYRGEQEKTSADAQVAGVRNQIASLHQQLTAAAAQYQQFKTDPTGTAVATNALQQMNTLRAQIGSLNTTVQSARSATQAVITSSVVLDPAAVVPASGLKHTVVLMFTGGVGGLAVGAGIVVLAALTSTRLRRREDVAAAADAPVTHSARRVGRRLQPAIRRRRGRLRSSYGLHVLAQGLESTTARPGVHRTALVTLDSEEVGLLTAAFAGARLSSERRSVFLVDLSDSGRLHKRVRRTIGAAVRPSVAPTVYRPDGVPAFARGPLTPARVASSELGPGDSVRGRWDAADVVFAVAPVDVDAGLDHLRGWADGAVLLVTAGRSTAEQISTAAGLLRSAGLELIAVLMVGTDGTDQSFGRRDPADAAPGRQSAPADTPGRWAQR